VNDLAAALQALKVGDFQARWEIAKQAEDWDETAMPPLLDLLAQTDTDGELQWFIARILGSFQHPEAILALARLLEQAKDEDVSLMAAQMLAGFGTHAINQLKGPLANPHSRPTAIRALAQMEQPTVVPLLLEAAQSGPGELRALALDALDKFQTPAMVPLLLQGLRDPNPNVRRAAIANLAVRGTEYPVDQMVVQLIPLLDDESLAVAEQVARALGRLATDQSAIALAQKCCNPEVSQTLQQTLIQCLGWICSSTAVKGLMQVWEWLEQQPSKPERLMQEVLTSISLTSGALEKTEAAQWLLDLVRSPALFNWPHLRARAVLALGQVADPSMLLNFIDLLRDSDYTVQLHIIAALKRLDSTQALHLMQQQTQRGDLEPELAAGLAIALQEW
jgi:HEAT repeat protein